MPDVVDILLVRHPETEANVNGRFVGRGESPYTAKGRRQLVRVARKIARFQPEVIWSSPLLRAFRLAQRAARLSAAPLSVDARVIEIDFGDAEGLTHEETVQAGIHLDYRSADTPVARRGESRASVEARVAAFCDEVVATGGRHAVVTHGGAFRAALVHLLGLSRTDMWAFDIANAQLAHVRVIDTHGMLEVFVKG